jgi:hypothetical protein
MGDCIECGERMRGLSRTAAEVCGECVETAQKVEAARAEERAHIVALLRGWGSEEAMSHVIGRELDWLGSENRQVTTLAELVCSAMANRIEGGEDG